MNSNSLKNVYSGSVVINGAETITGFNAARSISGMGFKVYGLTSHYKSVYLKANVWDKIYRSGYCCTEMIAIAKNIMQHQDVRTQKPALMLCQDEMVLFVSKHRAKLEAYFSFILPSDSSVQLMMDKTKFHAWAICKGFNVPRSIVITEENEIKIALETLNYPIVIKPLTRDDNWNKHFNNSKLFKFESIPSNVALIEEAFNYTEKLIFQEWIPGNDRDVFFLLTMSGKKGFISMSGRKIHQWPILTGSTAMCVSELEAEFENEAEDILKEASLVGLGSIEFKRDIRTNKYYITEPTVGRHDYQSFIATTAGVNLSLLYVLECMGYCYLNDFKPKKACWIDELNFIRATVKKKEFSLLFDMKVKFSYATFTFKEPKLFLVYWADFVLKKLRNLIRNIK